MAELRDQLNQILQEQNVVVSSVERTKFISCLLESIEKRKQRSALISKNRDMNTIIGLIQLAREAGDLDEAVWRCFLASHFGNDTICCEEDEEEVSDSAFRLLCAFKNEPHWTWKRFNHEPNTLHKWLNEHEDDLWSLSYGNHRKLESKQPERLWKVLDSFRKLAAMFGGPHGLVSRNLGSKPNDIFDNLYYRLKKSRRRKPKLAQFGRLGTFDFLVLLMDTNLITAQPGNCYLDGATGPLDGAELLWGEDRTVEELDQLAIALVNGCGISPIALEDALCRWQKNKARKSKPKQKLANFDLFS
jgi:hypothetical protein